MKERTWRRLVSVWIWCLLVSTTLGADTLVLRDGRRVRGQLIGISGDRIDFEAERGGFFGSRDRIRVDRRDVDRIEFDDSDMGRPDDRDRRDSPSSRPSGLRERDISVDSWVAWKDTGIDVRDGQAVYFSASGRVRWGPNRQDGPGGERNSPRNENRPIPDRPAAGLIGRIGESRDYFFIGDDAGPIRMRSSGRLYLGVNDDYLQDNSGSFRVVVYY